METRPCVLRRAMGKGKAEGGVWVAAQVVRRERGKFTRSDEQGCWGKRREGRDPLAPQPLRRTNGHVPSSSQRGRGRIGLAASRGRLACGSLAPASKDQFQPDFRSLDMHGCILQSIHAAHSAHTHHTVFSQPFSVAPSTTLRTSHERKRDRSAGPRSCALPYLAFDNNPSVEETVKADIINYCPDPSHSTGP